MNSIESLIKFIKRLIDKATEFDPDGVEYFEDLTIPACEINDLYDRVKKVEEELSFKDEEKLWQLFVKTSELNPGVSIKKVFEHAVSLLNLYKKCLSELKTDREIKKEH